MSKNRLAAIIVVCTLAIIAAIVLLHFEPWEGTRAADTYTLSTVVSPSGAGFISPSGGEYESGVQVTLAANPTSGYSFDYWSGSASGTLPTVTVTMDSDKIISANFKTTARTYTLTVDVNPSGAGSVSPSGGEYESGDHVTLTASSASGYIFDHWSGSASGTTSSITITMDSDKSITANFKTTDSPCNYECQQKTPGGYVGYQFEQSDFSKYEVIFNWTDTPKSNDVGIYPALLHFWFEAGQGGYTGPQIEVYNSGEKIVKKVIFSIWSINNQQFTAHPYCPHGTYGDTEGNFFKCLINKDPN